MTLYVYRIGAAVPLLTLEQVRSYTDASVATESGEVYGPFAEDCEFSSLPDCSETLRAGWRAANPSTVTRIEELETLVAELLFGGDI